ncbi:MULTISPECIES: PilN domain-containing protein [unclassified Pseudomonas]|uniref:PilN domain-containing protein n=1 Tax=unclassified Pseudomonas TaxID=196821 RepID=UPI002AC97404|nr:MULTISPECIES: PilN domain-containing protein [unclassified Pseudomonas]MEB0039938.1 MSHA biogenesis protein MshI [Pseudomonas sp. MH10]MEB0078831.1 MSHA biogenesis protein MshI [Pseudomonas sp. MH10out]MEB0089736.1 MSHA biogenesis protein MshI [Pseudomonas sp. CCI4.2]MEB0102989.1 MSHA biogenesis protein MshI [Pseudomonas sp. CCI3.2]MEB0121534.1 MSHA biogenesis protein MshI [Pseudomonas sp. CCI1.2]
MMQNLNLYKAEKKSARRPQKLEFLGGLAVVAVLCLCHLAWQGWNLHVGAQRLAKAQVLEQQQVRKLEEAKASFVQPVLDPQLPLRLADLDEQNRALGRLIDYLKVVANQQRVGFVTPLLALASQHPPSGLWLNVISLRDGGTQMRLQGFSQNQQMLPEYLGLLGENAAFKGREFARFNVQRGDDKLFHFDLSSRVTDPKDHP